MKLPIFLVGLIFTIEGAAQTAYLNVLNQFAHNSRPSLEVVGNTYYVANNLNTSFQTLDYVQLDTNGTVLNRLTYQADSTQLPSNCPKCLHYENGTLYHAYTDWIANIPGLDTIATVLCKINPDLNDTILTRYYYPTASKGLEIRDLEFDSDSTFIITGTSLHYRFGDSTQGFKYKILVARLDTAFNVLWETNILDRDPSRVYGVTPEDIVIDSYGSLVITGTPYWTGFYDEAFMIRLNLEDGQFLWRTTFHGDFGIEGMNSVDNGNGTYTYVQNWRTSTNQAEHQLHIGIIDTSGLVLQDTAYGSQDKLLATHDLIRLQDSSLYCAGITVANYERGFGFKFSEDLDSLWMRTFKHPSISRNHYLELFEQDLSGRIVHTGWTSQNRIDNWLFRIDTQGCTVSNCDISIDEYDQLDPRWSGFPIPSTGPLTIDHPELSSFSSVAIQVFDLAGKKVFAEIHDCAQPISINIEAPGQYQVLIGDENLKALGLLKVVIQ